MKTTDLEDLKSLVFKELNISDRVRVLVYLTKFSPYKSDGKCTLFIPKHGIFPENLDVKGLIRRGIPFVYLCRDFIEAYAGIFRPERIFYSALSSSQRSGQNIVISDDVFYILELLREPTVIDREALASFLEFGKVLGEKTLVRGINLLNAGLTLRVDEDGIVLEPGFHYGGRQVVLRSREELEEKLISITFEVFKEYVEAIRKEDALVVVPLSAGADSRFVLSMIHTLGYRNVMTVTYGLKDAEYPVARKVAETLGYENIFIEYTWNLWRKYLKSLLNYMVWASQLYLVPNIQEFISTSEIVHTICNEASKYCNNTVFVTGDISDVIAGKIPPPTWLSKTSSIEDFINFVMETHSLFESWEEYRDSLVKRTLLRSIEEIKEYLMKSEQQIDFVKIYEIFHWRETPFKYISSTRLSYIYYGFKFIVPLWDGRIIQFLSSIPWRFKYRTNFYKHTLRKHLFKPLGIALEDPTKRASPVKRMLSFVKPLVPETLVKFHASSTSRRSRNTGTPRNPCGFDVFFPRIFTLTYSSSKNLLHSKCEILTVANSYLKRAPRDIVAFNSLTCSLLIASLLIAKNLCRR
uniref:Asparagine synthetase domain-containing protein n=1 Tax=Ignisphaera aggregans TaxID=334771 RepID=A0A7J3Z6B9_9CREN